jgi:hypothetical protein
MFFDLNVNLRLSSRPDSHTLNQPKEFVLMTWIDDVAKQAQQDDEAKAARERAYNEQVNGLWSGLQDMVRRDVQEINRKKYLVENRLHKEPLQFEEQNSSSFKVSRVTIPSHYMVVSNRHRYIEVERSGRKTPDSETSREPLKKIEIETDADFHLYFVSPDAEDEAISIRDLSRYLLEPMLNLKPETPQDRPSSGRVRFA